MLAGVSADYYLRLEQGRGGQPSAQVVQALAQALRLDEADTDYLFALIAPPRDTRSPSGREKVSSTVLALLASIELPAGVFGRGFDVLAANSAARALSPELAPGHNRLRSLFLVDSERSLYGDSEQVAARYVAMARDALRRGASDPSFKALVSELEAASPRFRRLWATHDVIAQDDTPLTLSHPRVGLLWLHLERFDIPGGTGQSLFIGHPADSDTAVLLSQLSL